MRWQDILDEAVMAADLRRARRPERVGRYGRWRLKRALDAAAAQMRVRLPDAPGASQLGGAGDPVAETVELLQRARIGGRARGLGRADVGALYWRESDRRRARTRGSPKWLWIAVSVVVAGAVIAVVRLADDGGSATPVEAVTARGPLGDADAAAWVETLEHWAMALDALAETRSDGSTASETRERTRRVNALRKTATEGRPGAQMGGDVPAAMDRFMLAAEGASRPGRDVMTENLLVATALRQLNVAFVHAERPYFIDHATFVVGDDRIQVVPFVFRIEETRRFRAPDGTVVAHIVRRLDRLNTRQALLGYTKRTMDVALVRADSIEAIAEARLGPALSDGAGLVLRRPDGVDEASWDRLCARGGEVLRQVLGPDGRSAKAAAVRFGHAVLAHEAQHRVDYDGQTLRTPDSVARYMPGDTEGAEHATLELSAYTAELAHDPAWAKLGVLNLLEHFASGSVSAEAIAAAHILAHIGARLGGDGAPLTAGKRGDVAGALAQVERILDATDEAIAAAARDQWAEWFGRPLPALVAE